MAWPACCFIASDIRTAANFFRIIIAKAEGFADAGTTAFELALRKGGKSTRFPSATGSKGRLTGRRPGRGFLSFA
jgi:hypothetical protein